MLKSDRELVVSAELVDFFTPKVNGMQLLDFLGFITYLHSYGMLPLALSPDLLHPEES